MTQPTHNDLMTAKERDKWGKRAWDRFRELLAERGLVNEGQDYVRLNMHDEGFVLPTGIESVGAIILAKDGAITVYVLEWDPEKTNPEGNKGWYTLEVIPEEIGKWQNHPDYLAAKKRLGIA